jgi:ribosome recycling factor
MIADIKKSAEEKMKKSVESLREDFGKVRTGRATTGILDHVKVDYYGTPTLISQVANLTLIDAHTVGVQTWEKNMLGKVEKRFAMPISASIRPIWVKCCVCRCRH